MSGRDAFIPPELIARAEAVNFGSAPFEPPPRDELGRPMGGPLNRRAEISLKSKEWLELEGGVPMSDPIRCRPTPAARAIAGTC